MAAEGMQFSWRWNGGTIFANLDSIWGMSVNCRMTFHREETMRTLSTLVMRTLSTLATLILGLTFIPIRLAAVESRWVAGHNLGQQPGDDSIDCEIDVLALPLNPRSMRQPDRRD